MTKAAFVWGSLFVLQSGSTWLAGFFKFVWFFFFSLLLKCPESTDETLAFRVSAFLAQGFSVGCLHGLSFCLTHKGKEPLMSKSTKNAPQSHATLLCCDVLPGLKPWACQEIVERFGRCVILLASDDPTSIYLRYTGDLRELFSLRMVVAVSFLETFAVPRPRALLGHQHYHHLLEYIERVRCLHPPQAFAGLRISAAGATGKKHED